MEIYAKNIKIFLCGIVSFFTALWGWFGWLVLCWAACMGIDWFTGSRAAMKRQEWNSSRARNGIWHKGGMIAIVIVSGLADLVIGLIVNNLPGAGLPFEYDVLLCPLVIAWYIVAELGSIIENAISLGAPCPPFLKKALKVMQASVVKTGESTLPPDEEEDEESRIPPGEQS